MEDSDLLTIDEKTGKPPETKIASFGDAQNIVKQMWENDRETRRDRRIQQDMLDGEPPFNQADLDAANRGMDCNDNWGGGAARVSQAIAPYDGLVTNAPQLCEADVDHGRGQGRLDNGDIVARGLQKLFREWWPNSNYEFQELVRQFVTFGVGIGNHEHPVDFRYRSRGLDDVLFPRPMRPTTDDCKLYAWVQDYREDTLADWIKVPTTARKRGYNVKAVQDAIREAAKGTTGKSYELADYRTNGYGITFAREKTRTVRLFHLRTVEFDQKVSEVCGPLEGGDADAKYLFQSPRRLDSMDNAFTFFTFDLGNNTLHSIIGLARKIFATTQTENQVINRMVDYTRRAMTNYFQVTSPSIAEKFATIEIGADTLIPAGVTFVERQFPNLAANGIPFLNLLGSLQANNTGLYPSRDNVPGNNPAQTLGEAQQKIVLDTVLGTAALARFTQSYERLLNEVYRRLQNPRYGSNDPGFVLREKFRKYCMDQGMSKEAFAAPAHIRPCFAIGGGSPALAKQSIDQAMKFYPMLDPAGQRKLLSWGLSSTVGRDRAIELLPVSSIRRTTQQQINAETENKFFAGGMPQRTHPDDDDLIHAQTHLADISAVVGQLGGQDIKHVVATLAQGPLNPDQLSASFRAAFPHIGEHLRRLESGGTPHQGGDNTVAKETAGLKLEFNKAVQFQQRLDGFLQGLRNQAAQQQAAAANGGAPPGAPGAPPPADPKFVLEQQKAQLAIDTAATLNRMKVQTTQAVQSIRQQGRAVTQAQKLQHEQQEHQQDAAIRDADAAAQVLKQPAAVPATAPTA